MYSWVAIIFIIVAVSGTCFEHTFRPGLYVSLLIAALIGLVAVVRQKMKID
jgi:L-asparagine transporter-like permease